MDFPSSTLTPNHDALLTVRQAAIYLTVSEHTVRREIAAGHLAATRVGSQLRVRQSTLEQYLSDNTSGDTARQ